MWTRCATQTAASLLPVWSWSRPAPVGAVLFKRASGKRPYGQFDARTDVRPRVRDRRERRNRAVGNSIIETAASAKKKILARAPAKAVGALIREKLSSFPDELSDLPTSAGPSTADLGGQRCGLPEAGGIPAASHGGEGRGQKGARPGLGGDGEKVGPVLPLDLLLPPEPHVHFVNQGSGLEGVLGALRLELALLEGPQLVVDNGLARSRADSYPWRALLRRLVVSSPFGLPIDPQAEGVANRLRFRGVIVAYEDDGGNRTPTSRPRSLTNGT